MTFDFMALLRSILYILEIGVGFILGILVLYIIARVITLAYFKSKRDHENSTPEGK